MRLELKIGLERHPEQLHLVLCYAFGWGLRWMTRVMIAGVKVAQRWRFDWEGQP